MQKRYLIFFLLTSSLIFLLNSSAESGDTGPVQADSAPIAPALQELKDLYLEKGPAGASEYARLRKVKLEEDRVEVVLEFRKDHPVDQDRARAKGAETGRHYRNLLLARIPIHKIEAFSKGFKGLHRIRLPYRPHEAVESQGVGIMGAADEHTLGFTGLGVKVAIIDAGFGGLTTAQNAGELPAGVITVDYTGSGIGGTTHGTSVAEVVHDMAPDAELHLLKIGNDVHYGNAKDYCKQNGIRVINASIVWFPAASFYDGTALFCDIVNDAYANDILWVNAAGNYGNVHYEATLTDTDNDRKHEFSDTDEALSFSANAGKTIEIILNWDAYPSTQHDYDLFLYNVDPDLNPGASPVASSEYSQGGFWGGSPIEDLIYSVPSSGTYYLVVKKKSTSDANLPLDIYFFNLTGLEYRNYESSLAQPADAVGAFAVGAVYYATDGLRGFSSRGPTNDGRTKPEVTATDGVSVSTGTFSGTSASSPHVAGAAAIILSQSPGLNVNQLWSRLEAETKDLGSAGKDNLYGSGRISLDADQDGLTHDDEVVVYGTDPLVVDTDGDGLDDGDEVNIYGTNPALFDTDGDYYGDGDELAHGSDPLISGSTPPYEKGDIAPHGAPDGVVDIADALVAMRLSSGLLTETQFDLDQGDIAPLGSAPNGSIDLPDALLILQKAAGLTSF